MKVLMIGGTRYLGRAITSRLAARGDEVTVANRGQTAWDLPEGVQRMTADITQPGSLERALEGRTFDAAVHMIAMDAERARAVIEAIHDKVGHYVHCGSTGVYMPLSYVPADEEHPIDPPPDDQGGFNGKWAADQEAMRLCDQHSLPLTICRPTNVIGAGAVPIDIWGARDPRFFQRILDGKEVSIPNDGQALLQPGHVGDIADGFLAALDRPQKAGAYNLSCRYAITLDYYVALLGEALGREPKVEHVPVGKLISDYEPKGKLTARGILFLAAHMCFTMAKAERELGYDPKMRPEDSVVENVRWMFDEGIIDRS
jgi:nucleoside-diphosphate-sugar epimerase